jgi:DHA2 family multidrug resistance protein
MAKYKWWVLANIMVGTFMAVLDTTIINVGLPKIMSSLGVGIDKIEWVLTVYMLALAIALPVAGWLGDKFGYKRVYFYGMFLFTLGSLMCGLSNSANMLIISRIIQGLGAGTIQPLGLAIVIREFPPQQRGVAIGFWTIAAGASLSFGPILGGYLVDNFSWKLMFDINIPFGILGLFATVIIQKEYKNKLLRKFDYIGFISISLFLPTLLYALSEGNSRTNATGWASPHILMCFGIAIIALAVFITNEFTVKQPMVDLRLLKNRNFGLSYIILFIFGVGMFGSTFLVPIYLQNNLGYTAIQAGMLFLPMGILQGLLSPMAGKMSDKYNPKILIILGILILAFSLYLNTFLSFYTEKSFLILVVCLRGISMALLFSPVSTIALLEIPREKMAQASGLNNIIRQIGGSFGVAILATVLSSRINFHSQMYGQSINLSSASYGHLTQNTAYQLMQNVGVSFEKARMLSNAVVLKQLRTEAFIKSVNDDFLIASLVTLLSIIVVLFLRSKRRVPMQPMVGSMGGKQMSPKGNNPISDGGNPNPTTQQRPISK